MISIKKSAGLVNERGRVLLNPRPEASEPVVRRAPPFAGKLRALRDPKPRFPDSGAHSQNGRFESYVKLRLRRDPMPQILDSVGNPKTWCSRSYVNLQGSRHPTPHFPDRIGSSAHRPGLSPGISATFALEVLCFAVSLFALSRLSRAAAPDLGPDAPFPR